MRFQLIPKDDRVLAVMVKRQLMGFLSALMFFLPLVYAVEQEWLRFGYPGLALLTLASVATNTFFLLAIRLGFTQRFRDPTLNFPQVAVAALLSLVLAYYSDEATLIAIALFFSSFYFGAFSFTIRQYLSLTAAVAAGYAVMLLIKYGAAERSSEPFLLELLDFMVLVILLLWMSLLGSHIAALRMKVSKQKGELASALARLKELASRDELTGVHNRRHLMETLDQQLERSARHGEAFSLCILDLDFFKQVNDTHGHGVGDEVLCGFADRIKSQLRGMDVIGRCEQDSTFGRYGGEEFLLLLPYAETCGAQVCVERLRLATRTTPFASSAGDLPMTFSAGIAHYTPGESIADLIDRADAALYQAKTDGRDRVVVAPELRA